MRRRIFAARPGTSGFGRGPVFVAAGVVVAEAIIILAIHRLHGGLDPVVAVLNGVLLAAITAPLLYVALVRPLRDGRTRLRAVLAAAGDGIVIINSRGIIESFNPAAEAMFGLSAAETLGRNVAELMPSPLHEQHDAFLAQYAATGESHIVGQSPEVMGRRADGTTFPIELTVSEVRVGGEVKFTGILRDVSKRKQAEERFKTLTERSPIGIYIVQDRALQYVNPRFVDITGFKAEELLGRHPLYLVAPEDRALVRESAVRMLRGEYQGYYEYRLRNRAGEVRNIMENVVSLEYRGRPATYGYFVDITDRKRAEDAVRESEERYRATFQHIHDVLFTVNEHGILTMVSPSVEKLLGYAPDELPGSPVATLFADAAEAENVRAMVIAGKAIEDREALFARKDGSHVVVSLAVWIIVGEEAGTIALQGAARDISTRKLAEDERDRYFEMSIDPLAVHDRRTVLEAAVAAAEGRALEDKRARFLTRDGEVRWLSWNTTPVTDGASYSVVRDVTEQVRAQAEQDKMMKMLEENARVLMEQALELDALRTKAEYAARHDMLTGLANRRAWFDSALANRGSAVAIIDIDRFKQVNDDWGHPAGDAVLVEVSRRLQASVDNAILGRVGGEEFAVLFQGSLGDAIESCDRALAAVATPIRLPGGEEIEVTLSVGLAPWNRGRVTREDGLARTYEAADRALYVAKKAGRARLVVSEVLQAA